MDKVQQKPIISEGHLLYLLKSVDLIYFYGQVSINYMSYERPIPKGKCIRQAACDWSIFF